MSQQVWYYIFLVASCFSYTHGCTCGMNGINDHMQYSFCNVNYVFTAKVLSITTAIDTVTYNVQIQQTFKGSPGAVGATVSVISPADSADCKLTMYINTDYTIFAMNDNGQMTSNRCSNTLKRSYLSTTQLNGLNGQYQCDCTVEPTSTITGPDMCSSITPFTYPCTNYAGFCQKSNGVCAWTTDQTDLRCTV